MKEILEELKEKKIMAIIKQYLEENIKSVDYKIADINDKIKVLNDEKFALIGKRNAFQEVLYELIKGEELCQKEKQ